MKRKLTKAACCFLVLLLALALPFPTHAEEGEEAPVFAAPGAKVNISFAVPDWSNKDIATVGIVIPEPVESIQARYGKETTWTDVTDERNIKIDNNAIVYVQATTEDGTVTNYSEYVECFDRTAPDVTAVVNGNRAVISAQDTQSGIAAIYVNNNKYTQFSDNTIDYYIDKSETSLLVQAEDKAGNLSRSQTVRTNNSNSSSSSNSNSSSSDQGIIGNAKIDIITPAWTNKNKVYVKVNVSGQNLDRIEARSSRGGSWVSIINTMDIEITENTDVYVRVTDIHGSITTASERIDCFDKTAPTVNATQEGRNITINAYDSESGVATLYANGKPTETQSGTITFTVQAGTTRMVAQAKDNAGNLSEPYTLSIDQSAFYEGGSSSPASSGTVQGSGTDTGSGDIYYITIGGETLTLEELQQAGVPIYIFTGENTAELQDMLDENYRALMEQQEEPEDDEERSGGTLDNIITVTDVDPETGETITVTGTVDPETGDIKDENGVVLLAGTETDGGEVLPGEEAGKKAAASWVSFSDIFIIAVVVLGAVGGFVYVKLFKKREKFPDDEDMYEADFDEDNFDDEDYSNDDYEEEIA